MVDIFYTVHEQQYKMAVVVQVGFTNIIIVKPGCERLHKIRQITCFHWNTSYLPEFSETPTEAQKTICDGAEILPYPIFIKKQSQKEARLSV
jgi:hypothetical protein